MIRYSRMGFIAKGTVPVAFRVSVDMCNTQIADKEDRMESIIEEVAEKLSELYDVDDIVETDYITITKEEITEESYIVEGTAKLHATVYVSARDREGAYEAADEEVFKDGYGKIITDIYETEWDIDEDEPDWEQDD